MRHLPAIDGLRAIAVLAVVAYHAGLPLPAGFVGVDVFFVISGYLITRLLADELRETGRIDFMAFYARRVRRIFPAAAVVVLSVLVASAFLLGPEQRSHTSLSAGSALVFGANVFFQFMSGGYFDDAAETMPLLHLWSLSVEEQFYLLWPLLVATLPRRWLRPGIVALALASFALCEWWVGRGSSAGFYQMPARFWELAAGGLLATLPTRALPRWAAPAGLLATLWACVSAYYSAVGVLPAVAGSALLIAAIHGGARVPLLELRPVVAIGLVSYSLYLWHWPLLAFYRATSIGEGSLTVRIALCALALLLAAASYRWIEQPFRRARWPKGRTVAGGAALSVALASGACAVGMQRPAVLPDDPLAVRAERDRPSLACHSSSTDPATPKCAPGRMVMWGDSMAYAWSPIMAGKGVSLSRGSCGPFLGFTGAHPTKHNLACRDFNAAMAEKVKDADTVVLVAYWSAGNPSLRPTLSAVANVRRVVILGPTPTMRDWVPRCIRQHADCSITRAAFDAHARPILVNLRGLAAEYPNVEVIDLTDYLCTATRCEAVRGGVPVYWDTHHVTASVARAYGGVVL